MGNGSGNGVDMDMDLDERFWDGGKCVHMKINILRIYEESYISIPESTAGVNEKKEVSTSALYPQKEMKMKKRLRVITPLPTPSDVL